MKGLKIASNLSLPVETVTQTVGILAKRRAGKSYAARRFAEQLFKADQQIVVVDPKGDWYGIRSSADGRGPGLPIIILGGEHGDLKQLEPGAGEIIAKLIVEERVSVVLDLSTFRKGELARFMGGPTPPRSGEEGFLEALYRLKARDQYRTPMMLIIDEADAIAPQKPMKGEERMLGAAEDIVRRGGQRGIGCIMITQRSAVLNKNLLTQVEVLIALRTIAPQDLEALNAWIDVHGTPEQQRILMGSLPALPTGDAWVWSPGWPTVDGIFEHVHVLPIETFDSGATPTGKRPVEPKKAADVDLDALKRQMAATIERAKAEDPRELRRQIAEWKKKAEAKQPMPAPAPRQPKRVEVLVLKDGQIARLEKLFDRVGALQNRFRPMMEEVYAPMTAQCADMLGALKAARNGGETALRQEGVGRRLQTESVGRAMRRSARAGARIAATHSDHLRVPADLGKGESVILTAAAQHVGGVTREQIAVLTGYKRSSRNTYIQRLTSRGLLEERGDRLVPTTEGLALLGPIQPLPTGRDLRQYWLERLPPGESIILKQVLAAYPAAIERDALGEATEYARSSRNTYLQRLSARQLVMSEGRGMVRASEELFHD